LLTCINKQKAAFTLQMQNVKLEGHCTALYQDADTRQAQTL